MRNTDLIDAPPQPRDAPGDEDDFAALFREHYHRVVRALELGGLDHASAEDVAEEAFARTLGHWRRVRNGTNPPGYVFRTAFRLSRRRLARAPNLPLDPESASREDPLGDLATRLDLERVIASLPPRRRACAVLCFVVGLSTKEAAAALGIAEGTVRKQLGEARTSLQGTLLQEQ